MMPRHSSPTPCKNVDLATVGCTPTTAPFLSPQRWYPHRGGPPGRTTVATTSPCLQAAGGLAGVAAACGLLARRTLTERKTTFPTAAVRWEEQPRQAGAQEEAASRPPRLLRRPGVDRPSLLHPQLLGRVVTGGADRRRPLEGRRRYVTGLRRFLARRPFPSPVACTKERGRRGCPAA